MRGTARKTAPAVRDGRVVKKNRHERTPTYWNTTQATPVIDRERPGKGYRHILRKEEVGRFLEILPDWDACAVGLDAIVLATGKKAGDGWYDQGVIGICAWERSLSQVWSNRHFKAHAAVLKTIGVPCSDVSSGVVVEFTEPTVRAYQLVHIFLHELGNHIDRMTTRSRSHSARGEGYSEDYALRYQDQIWKRYCETFDHV